MNAPDAPLPDACAVAFKEWAGIVAALAEGGQSLILRKGGIAEGPGPGEFVPEHPAFWFYPTRLHEGAQGLRTGPPAPWPDPDTVPIGVLARVESIAFVDQFDRLEALADLHVWTAETVAQRFHYRRPGVWVLGVRAFSRPEPSRLAVTPEQAGCKTWVPLDPPLPTAGLAPVLDDAAQAHRRDRLRDALA